MYGSTTVCEIIRDLPLFLKLEFVKLKFFHVTQVSLKFYGKSREAIPVWPAI